jgi:hypothetical protein
MTRKRFNWFKAAVAIGFLLGIVLLVESTLTYRYVTRHLIRDHLTWQAAQHIAAIESRTRQFNIDAQEELRALTEEICEEHQGQIAWIRIVDGQGRSIAQSGGAFGHVITKDTIETILRDPAHTKSEVRSTPVGDVLVVAMPLPFQLRNMRAAVEARPQSSNHSDFYVAEIALAMAGPNDLFRALRNNLAISIGSALALLLSMAVVFVRLPAYLRGREMEEQLALARAVQQRLLPAQGNHHGQLDFAATCHPAFQVGGDYYDVFAVQHNKTALVLADVAGKGLPASLLMAHLHGAVRSVAALDEGEDLASAADHLNQLLSTVTSRERFASLFWAYYSSEQQTLRYVNAGHLAPMLVRRKRAGEFECHRLDRGGPVLGLLPHAVYEQGECAVAGQDVVVMYSDGLAEATNKSDVEFGDERLLETVEANWGRPVVEIQRAILNAVNQFIGACELQDDLTVLVVRFGAE